MASPELSPGAAPRIATPPAVPVAAGRWRDRTVRWRLPRAAELARSVPTVAAIAIFAWVVMAIFVVALLLHERETAIERTGRTGAAIALVLEAHVARTFQAVDATLAGVADTLHLAQPPKHDPAFREALARRVSALQPYVRALYVIGPDGTITHDTDYPKTPNVSLADRPYFRAYREDPHLERALSGPLQSRSGQGWFLAATRRAGSGDTLDGVVVAAVQPRYFESLYARMGLGSGDVIALYHRDGTLIARFPDDSQAIGRSFAEAPIFTSHLPKAASGSYRTHTGVLAYDRVVSYRALDDLPLVVALSQSTDNVLAGWRRTAYGAAAALFGAMVLLAVLIAQVAREQRLRDAARERQAQAEKLRALGHLTGGIAHDFANLLSIVSSNLEVLARSLGHARDEEPVSSALGGARRAAERGAHLTRRLLAFARRRDLRIESADLCGLVREAAELVRQALGPRMMLELDLAERLPPCVVDIAELDIALVNLAVNARDASGGEGRVMISTGDGSIIAGGDLRPAHGDPGAFVCLSVRDEGAGMSEDVRRRALEPFYTTKGDTGTGLGLSQVFGFMQQIGGDVSLDSAPGKGTIVHLWFRKASAHEREHTAEGPTSLAG